MICEHTKIRDQFSFDGHLLSSECEACGMKLFTGYKEMNGLERSTNNINSDGLYAQIDNKVVSIANVPATGFGQTVINWADGKPVSAETTTKHKIKY